MTGSGWLWENEKWIPTGGVPLTDRGFRHGMSVFETIGIVSGRLIFLKEHLAKLREACARLGLRPVPENLQLSLENLDMGCETGVARLYITAGDGTLHSSLLQGRILFFTEPRPSISLPSMRLHLHPDPVVLPWPSLKTGNYWTQIQAHQEAIAAGFDEAVLVNTSGHVISAATANLFAVIDGQLVTPRTASGARSGVMRDWVLQNAEVVVCDFHSAQLLEASEIFLTSSGIVIASVSQINTQEIIQKRIAKSLRANCEREINQMTNVYFKGD